MTRENVIFIATSLDGYIADEEGSIDFLETGKTQEDEDTGFDAFMEEGDALVMGRGTYEAVMSFGVWPYEAPVFVLSRSLEYLPEELSGRAEIIEGTPAEVTSALNERGFDRLYIDGGLTIQSFLEDDMIDRMIITRIPILLGAGRPLFSQMTEPAIFRHVETTLIGERAVTSEYERVRE